MAEDSSHARCGASADAKKRITWSTEETKALVELWKSYLPRLRGCTRNARYYEAIAAELSALFAADEALTAKHVKQKIENLNKKYK